MNILFFSIFQHEFPNLNEKKIQFKRYNIWYKKHAFSKQEILSGSDKVRDATYQVRVERDGRQGAIAVNMRKWHDSR